MKQNIFKTASRDSKYRAAKRKAKEFEKRASALYKKAIQKARKHKKRK